MSKRYMFSLGSELISGIVRNLLVLAIVMPCLAFIPEGKCAEDLNAKDANKSTSLPSDMDNFATTLKGDYFEISESGCMGGCPSFYIDMYADGKYKFQKRSDRSGSTISNLGEERTKELFDEIEKFKFKEVSNHGINCGLSKSDQATIRMKLHALEKWYQLDDYLGCKEFDGKKELREFERKINAILLLDKLNSE